jgi:predicted  nucleic acid-binding Zn-ribbon protein
MPENTGAATTPEDEATQPQAGTTQQAQEASAEPEAPSLDEVRKLRSEHRALRERAKAAEEQLKRLADEKRAAEEAALPERERYEKRVGELTQQIEQLRNELREERGKGAVVNAASSLGFAKPEQAYALLLYERSLEYDNDGRPTNVESALKALLKENPHLASAAVRASGSADQGARGTLPPLNDMNRAIRQAAGRA